MPKLKNIKLLFLALLFPIAASAEVSYYIGGRIEKDQSGKQAKKSLIAKLTTEQKMRVWNLVRCELPDNKNCVSYEFRFLMDETGKWNLEYPTPSGKVLSPIVGDVSNFSTRWSIVNGSVPCCSFKQTIDKNAIVWDYSDTIGKVSNKIITRLTSIKESQYLELFKTRPSKPLSVK